MMIISLRDILNDSRKSEDNKMNDTKNRVCPVKKASSFDSKLRNFLQNPNKILKPYVREGMIVLDFGCGSGYFSIPMANMVSRTGKVISADLQSGMLGLLRSKIKGKDIAERILLHKCEKDSIGLNEEVDFVLAFYVVHEVLDQRRFFKELKSLLKPNGRVLIVEPKMGHVSYEEFVESVYRAKRVGLTPIEHPKILFSHSTVLQNAE